MSPPVRRTVAAATGGALAAFASALCCAGPLVAVALGISGAGVAATFEPLRPWFLALSVVALGTGFLLLRREERRACAPGQPCATPRTRRLMRGVLLAATALAMLFATFPFWSGWFFEFLSP